MQGKTRKDPRTGNARRLRREMTLAEKRLWAQLRLLELPGGHFRRQAPMGPYFADFAHFHAKLVIELDGDQHGLPLAQAHDAARTAYLAAHGYRVLRFWNREIAENLDGVVETIFRAVHAASPAPTTIVNRKASRTDFILAAFSILLLSGSPAVAQTPGAAPSSTTPGSPPPVTAPAARPGQAMLSLGAQFSGSRKPIRSGLVWRVLTESFDGSPPRIVARSNDAEPSFALDPGVYLLHAAYGFASATKRVTLGAQGLSDRLSLSAGALSLAGSIGETPIAPNQLSFSVFVPLQGNSEGRLVASGVKSGELIRLPEGTYHIVSTYGDSNAIQRSDVRVDSGQVTQATLHHRAAQVTLKLVAGPGGEAFAGTAFSVLTPGGDVIREAIGAFPQVILAEGDYVLIARQEGQVFSRDFKVEAGRDRDIEVIAR